MRVSLGGAPAGANMSTACKDAAQARQPVEPLHKPIGNCFDEVGCLRLAPCARPLPLHLRRAGALRLAEVPDCHAEQPAALHSEFMSVQMWTREEALSEAEFHQLFGDCACNGKAVAQLVHSWSLDHKVAALQVMYQRPTSVRHWRWLDMQLLRGKLLPGQCASKLTVSAAVVW